MALLTQLSTIFVVVVSLLHFTAGLPTPTHNGENRSPRRRSSSMLPQEPINQSLSNRLTDLGSQEGLVFGSGEVFSTRHNETRQSRLVAERKLRNVTSSQFNRTTGSQLNICTLEPSYLCLMEPVQPQRNKQMRILAIKDMVLSQLGRTNKAPTEMTRMSSSNSLTRLNGEVPSSPFSGELRTFYASCDLPNKVGAETWTMPGFFHLFFNVSSGTVNPSNRQIRTSTGTSPYPEYYPVTGRQQKKPVNVISAKLRLYKVGRGSQTKNDLSQNITLSEPCNETTAKEGLENIAPSEMTKTTSNIDEKIRVSIYWYTMPATKHHYKKKLLDTKMLSLKDSEWIDFDIQKAVRAWLEKKLNYGLIIEVENEDNDLVDAKNYFSNIACPQTTSDIQTQENSSQSLDATAGPSTDALNAAVPVLEICTLSIANSVPYTDADRHVEYPPFPFPVASVSTHQGRHHAEARIANNEGFAWQNDGMADQPISQTHHHRRHHGHHGAVDGNRQAGIPRNQRTPKPTLVQTQGDDTQNSETTTQFRFNDDHPLRSIFSKPFLPSRRGSEQNLRQAVEESDYSDLESSEEKKQEDVHKIVIENVFVESPQNSGRTR